MEGVDGNERDYADVKQTDVYDVRERRRRHHMCVYETGRVLLCCSLVFLHTVEELRNNNKLYSYA